MSYSANDSVQLSFRYEEKEFLAASRLYFWRSPQLLARFALIVVAFAIGMLVLDALMDFVVPLWALAAMVVLVCVAWFHGFVIDVPRKRFRGDPKFRDEYHLTFSHEKIEFRTENVSATFAWNFYTRVIEDANFYLLVYGNDIPSLSIIPKRTFRDANQETLFRQMLRRNIDANLKLGHSEREAEYVPESLHPPDWR